MKKYLLMKCVNTIVFLISMSFGMTAHAGNVTLIQKIGPNGNVCDFLANIAGKKAYAEEFNENYDDITDKCGVYTTTLSQDVKYKIEIDCTLTDKRTSSYIVTMQRNERICKASVQF